MKIHAIDVQALKIWGRNNESFEVETENKFFEELELQFSLELEGKWIH
jgi:hypothetical protein